MRPRTLLHCICNIIYLPHISTHKYNVAVWQRDREGICVCVGIFTENCVRAHGSTRRKGAPARTCGKPHLKSTCAFAWRSRFRHDDPSRERESAGPRVNHHMAHSARCRRKPPTLPAAVVARMRSKMDTGGRWAWAAGMSNNGAGRRNHGRDSHLGLVLRFLRVRSGV